MEDRQDRKRITWTTRINIRPSAQESVRAAAKEEHISVATVIGMAVEDYVTARSTT